MKKLFLIGLLVLAMLVTVVACNNTPEQPETEPNTTVGDVPSEEPTETPTTPTEDTTDGSADATDPEETTAEPDDGYPENRLVVDKETYLEGDQIFITAYGGGKDWVGVARVGETEVIRWWYLEKVDGFKNVRSGIKFDITAAEANGDNDTALTAGDYIIYLVADDKKLADNDFIQIAAISIVKNDSADTQEPENERTESIDLSALNGKEGAEWQGTPLNAQWMDEGNGIYKLFINRYVSLGELNLAAFKKAKVTYGYDIAVNETYTGSKVGLLANKELAVTWAGEDNADIFGSTSLIAVTDNYAYGMQTVEIDLSAVDYSGEVYICFAAGGISIYSIEFVVDESYVEPEIPYWSDSDTMKHQSFDELDMYAGSTKVAGAFTPGQSAGWDFTINLDDASFDTLRYWGWIAGTGGLGQFGYQINNGAHVYNDAWTYPEDMMQHAPAGSDHATRMAILIPLNGLDGANTIRVLYKNAAGVEVLLNTITVNVTIPDETEPDEPETNEPETNEPETEEPVDPSKIESVDLSALNGADGAEWAGSPLLASWQDEGNGNWKLFINRYVSLGNINLANYAKVRITYGFDMAVNGSYAGSKVGLLSNKDLATTWNGGDANGVFGYTSLVAVTDNYAAGKKTVTIDLSTVAYDGEVYVCFAAGGISIYSIEFIIADTPTPPQEPETNEPETNEPETPVEPAENYVVDLSALNGADGAEWAGSPLPASWQDEGNGNWKLFINRFVSLGNLNLADFAKVKITYGFDASVNDAYAGTVVGLLNSKDLAAAWAGADGEGVFGYTTLVPVTASYAAGKQTVEIDLSAVAYDGEVYVCFVAGGISIYSIEFVAAEETDEPETPVEPAEDYVVDLSALNGADGAEWAGSPLPASWQDEGNGNWKLFINKFVSLGNLNLSNYTKVKITYGFDMSVNGSYAGSKVGLLSNKDLASAWGGADGEGVFGYTDLIAVTDNYAAGKQTVEIDLSAISYDGEVYVCFVAGGISIYSIEFVA